MINEKNKRIFAAIGSIIGWATVLLQFYLIMVNRVASVTETTIRFLSFFTILTNIIVAIAFTSICLKATTPSSFLNIPKRLAAIAVYISIVGLVYNIILRPLWNPTGMQMIVDELLHSFIPLYYILFWLIFIPKENLKWNDVFPWLLYPLIYVFVVLIRGHFSGYYPYPFFDVVQLGKQQVLINSLMLLIVFMMFSILLIGLSKLKNR